MLNEDRTFSILRAAAATGSSTWLMPSVQETGPNDLHGADALADAALRACLPLLSEMTGADLDRTGVVIGTAFGCLETDRLFDRSRREHGGRYASPAAFSRTLPSTVAAELALKLSLRGPGLVITRGNASTALALRRAVSWMVHLELAYCIAGGMEWAEVSGATAALVLIGRDRNDAGTLCVKSFRESDHDHADAGIPSLQKLFDWIQGERHVAVGNGVELRTARQFLADDAPI
jgi:hypothetical protein